MLCLLQDCPGEPVSFLISSFEVFSKVGVIERISQQSRPGVLFGLIRIQR